MNTQTIGTIIAIAIVVVFFGGVGWAMFGVFPNDQDNFEDAYPERKPSRHDPAKIDE